MLARVALKMAGNSPARETLIVQVHCLRNYPLTVPHVEKPSSTVKRLPQDLHRKRCLFPLRLYLNPALITFADSQNLQAGAFISTTSSRL